MPSTEETRGNGLVVGWGVFIAMLFNPAALKRGQGRIEVIAGALAVSGLLMNLVGSRIGARHRKNCKKTFIWQTQSW